MKRILSTIIALSILLSGCSNVEKPVELDEVARNSNEIIVSDGSEEEKQLPEGSTFEVRYLDVGQADAALVQCDGQTMLIDGGNVEDSSLIVAVLKKLGISHLDYVINTHPHEDHIGGLAGALNVCDVGQVMCPVTSYDSKAFSDFLKYVEAQGKRITVPEDGDIFELGSSQVVMLGPVKDYAEANNQSMALKIEYGKTSFLFTGDMERDAEQDLLEEWSESELASTVLKVGHHGSENSTSYTFLRAVMPSVGIISVGKDNTYGHPTEAVLSRLRDAGVKVYRTDLQGDIVASSDGQHVTFKTYKNENTEASTSINPNSSKASGNSKNTSIEYIGNKNSHKFHLPSCHTLPAEKNRKYFDNRSEAVNAGYSSCGNCHP